MLLILTSCEKPLEVKIVEPATDPVEPNVYNMPLIHRQGLNYKPHSIEPFTGDNRVWYKDGQLKERANYVDGKLSGLIEQYYRGGNLSGKVSYKDGKLNGLAEQYFTDGLPLTDYPKCYQNGEEVDLSICKQ